MGQRPNALLVVLDATRKDHLSCYGYDRPTSPTIDRIAADGTRFEQAIASAPWTPPSHASMFTGCYSSRHGVFNSHLSLTYEGPTIAEQLSANGVETLGYSNSYHTSTDRGFHRGFDYYHDIFELPRFLGKMYDPSLDFLRFLPNYFLKNYDISDLQLRKLKTRLKRTDEHFFGFINLNSAHTPYDPPARFRKQFEAYFDEWDTVDEEAAADVSKGGFEYTALDDKSITETEWRLIRCWYDAEIRYMDYLLADLIESLKKTGLYDDTLLIITADHGEHLGEHGLSNHSFSLFDELLNVPLIVKWPGDHHVGDRTLPGSVSNNLVSLIDIAPTICEWLGTDIPSEMQGRALTADHTHDAVFAEYDRPQPPRRDRLLRKYDKFEAYDRGLQAVRTSDFKLIRTTRGKETLYRIENGEEVPVENPEVHRQLSERMDETLSDVPDSGVEEELSKYVKENLEKMGYL
jgi:arylsulfatase A-like enzyme